MTNFPDVKENANYLGSITPEGSRHERHDKLSDQTLTSSMMQVRIHQSEIDLKNNSNASLSTSQCSSLSDHTYQSSGNLSRGSLSGWGSSASRKSYSSGLSSLADGGDDAIEKVRSPRQEKVYCLDENQVEESLDQSSWGFFVEEE